MVSEKTPVDNPIIIEKKPRLLNRKHVIFLIFFWILIIATTFFIWPKDGYFFGLDGEWPKQTPTQRSP
jgi:hypothetical protein